MLTVLSSDEEFKEAVSDSSTYSVVLFQKDDRVKSVMEIVLMRLASQNKNLSYFKMNANDSFDCCKDVTILPSVIIYQNSMKVESVVGGDTQEMIRLVLKVSNEAKSNLGAMGGELVKSSSDGNDDKSSSIQHSSPSSGGGSSGSGGFAAKGSSPTVAGFLNGGKRPSSGIMQQSILFTSPFDGGFISNALSRSANKMNDSAVTIKKDDSAANSSKGSLERSSTEGAGESLEKVKEEEEEEGGLDATGFRLLMERIRVLEERNALLSNLKNRQAVEISRMKDDASKMKKEMEDRESKVNGQLTTMQKEVSDHKDAAAKELRTARRFKDELDTAKLYVEQSAVKLKEKGRELGALKQELAASHKKVEELTGANQFLADMVGSMLGRDDVVKEGHVVDAADEQHSAPLLTSTPNGKLEDSKAKAGDDKNSGELLAPPSKRKCIRSIGDDMVNVDDALKELSSGAKESSMSRTGDKNNKDGGGDGETMLKDTGRGTIQEEHELKDDQSGLKRVEEGGDIIGKEHNAFMHGVYGKGMDGEEEEESDGEEMDSDDSYTKVTAHFDAHMRKNKNKKK